MLNEIFNINTFNIYSDNEYYYFFRALNMADNNDLETGIILNEQQEIERIRTNLERFEGLPKYSKDAEISLEEMIEHIKMHQRKDTNCISLTSNANTALTYGRGNYKDKYVMVKVPKEELGKQVYQAGLYIIEEINKKINELIEQRNLEDYDMQKYFFDAIDNAGTQERLDEIKRMLPQKKDAESSLEFETGLEFYLTTSKNFQSLNEKQNFEKNKAVLKLDVLNRRLIPKISNEFLIQTLGNAFSSLELIHYKEISKEKIIELPKEIVDILGLLQQLPNNLEYLDEIKEKVLKSVNTKVDIEYDYKDFSVVENEFNLDDMYNLTNGLIDYKSAITIYQKAFYLAKSKLRTKNSVELLNKILNNNPKYKQTVDYILYNTYGIEPEITTKLSKALLQVSESVSLNISKNERNLVEFINKLSYEELEKILNEPQQTLEFLLQNFLSDKEILFDSKEDWYANSIINLLDFKALGVKENLSASQREDIIKSLKENNFLDIYYELKKQGIKEKDIAYKLFAKLIKDNELEKFTLEELEYFIGYNRVKGTNLQLRYYQKDALENINRVFKEKQFTSVILPTGTGKSYVAIAKMLEHKDEQLLYLAPNVEILNQLQQIIINTLDPEKHLGDTNTEIVKRLFPNLTLSTYQNLKEENAKDIINSQYNLIIFDELHRTGATEWNKHIKTLLDNQNRDTKVLGITATPERDVDLKNMTEYWAKYYGYTDEEIILGKHIAINMNIIEAIKLGIIANPKVVNCEYSLLNDEYLENLKISIDNILDESIKEEHLKKYEMLRRQVANSSGIEKILHDNLMSNGKYIVFLPITKKDDGAYEDEDGNKVDKSTAERVIKDYQTIFKQYLFSYNYFEQEGLEILDIYEKMKNNIPLSNTELSYLQKEKNNILLLAKIDIKGKSNALNVESNIIADVIINYMNWSKLSKEEHTKNLGIKTKSLVEDYSMLGSYSDKKNASNLREFNKEAKDKMKLMFVMNKLNEGVHANGIKGIIWLRALDENSKILYLQQLGRCISAVKPGQIIADEDRPLVIDLVNNTLKVKFDKGELKEQKDLNKLLLIESWINLNGRIPSIESSLKIEKEYALNLYHIYNSYIKYVDNNNLLNDLNVKTKLLVEEIIKVGSNIDLWNLDLHREEMEANKRNTSQSSNELLDLFEIKGVIRDFVDLEDSISCCEDKWLSRYYYVKKYFEQYGTINEIPSHIHVIEENGKIIVIDKTDERYNDSFAISDWLNTQRRAKANISNSIMNSKREKLLNELNFNWDIRDYDLQWNYMFELLSNYYLKYGNCNVKKNYRSFDGIHEISKDDPRYDSAPRLGLWVNTQRQQKKGNRRLSMPIERQKKLENIGFEWDAKIDYDSKWNRCYNLLLNFKKNYGHLNIPINFKTKDGVNASDEVDAINLYNWLHQQKQNYKNNEKPQETLKKKEVRLTEERIVLLESIGVNLSVKRRKKYEEAKQDFDEVSKFNEIVEGELKENVNGRTTL